MTKIKECKSHNNIEVVSNNPLESQKSKSVTFMNFFEKMVFSHNGCDLIKNLKNIFDSKEVDDVNGILDLEIQKSEERTKRLKQMRDYAKMFGIILSLLKVRVMSFGELKDTLDIHPQQLTRVLSFLNRNNVIRSASFNPDKDVLHILDVKRWANRKNYSFYELGNKYKQLVLNNEKTITNIVRVTNPITLGKIDDACELMKIQDQRYVAYQYRQGVKNKKEHERNRAPFTKINEHMSNFPLGTVFHRNQLVKEWTFYNKIAGSEQRAIKYIDHLLSEGYFIPKEENNKMLIIYKGEVGMEEKAEERRKVREVRYKYNQLSQEEEDTLHAIPTKNASTNNKEKDYT